MGMKKPLCKLLILLLAAVLAGCGADAEETTPPAETSGRIPEETTQMPTEEQPVIALPTNYIVLNYPAEIQEDVKVSYEDMQDGQKITFTTGFTGEELELFQFIISKSDSAGFVLGTLEDEQAGQMFVCVNVCEYAEGNWEVSEYTRLNELQSRVNDIIVQFYDDPRFQAANG